MVFGPSPGAHGTPPSADRQPFQFHRPRSDPTSVLSTARPPDFNPTRPRACRADRVKRDAVARFSRRASCTSRVFYSPHVARTRRTIVN